MKVSSVLHQANSCPILPLKISLYNQAIELCMAYGLRHRRAAIYCILSELYFYSAKDLVLSLESAEAAIAIDPTYGEVSA